MYRRAPGALPRIRTAPRGSRLGPLVTTRAYTAERTRRERLEFLYGTALTLSGTGETGAALERMLAQALPVFAAGAAELVFLSPTGEQALRSTVHPEGPATRLEPVDATLAARLRESLAGAPTSSPSAAITDPWLAAHLRSRGVGDGMFAVLAGEPAPIGAIMIGGRRGRSDALGPADLALFTALAANTAAALRTDQTVWQMRKLRDDLEHQAAHDPLTDLINRTRYASRLTETLAAGPREAAVILLDVDDFKRVNDTLGQAAGDELLVAIAGRLRACGRPGHTLARLGADEFAVLVGGGGAESAAVELAGLLDTRLRQRFSVAGGPLAVRVSIGVAVGAGRRVSSEELLRNADLAMQRAKQAQAPGYELFATGTDGVEQRHHGVRQRLRDAARRADFKVHYQPIVDLGSGAVAAREALVRWQDGPRGPVHPASFIPIAEEMGVIVDIGRQVLRRACVDAQGWREQHTGTPAVHVNLSPVEVRDPDFLTGVSDALSHSGLDPQRLVLEITERVVLSDPPRAIVILEQLRDLGVRVALDDFGTGYSSLSHLRWLPLDTLKIGQTFVGEIEQSGSSRPFLRMILELATSLGLQVVAEGIETRAQLRVLRGLGCGFGQGFYLGSPAAWAGPAFPADELELRLESSTV